MPEIIQCITLGLFFSEISIGSFLRFKYAFQFHFSLFKKPKVLKLISALSSVHVTFDVGNGT